MSVLLAAVSVVMLLVVLALGSTRRKLLRAVAAYEAGKVRFDVFVQTSRVRAAILADAIKAQTKSYELIRDGRGAEAAAEWDRGMALVRSVVAKYEHDEAKYVELDDAVDKAIERMS